MFRLKDRHGLPRHPSRDNVEWKHDAGYQLQELSLRAPPRRSVAWQSGAVKFGLTDRHGTAPSGAAPRDDMAISRGA